MSDCECGAHYMQSCSWWCGLTQEQKNAGWRSRNPAAYTADKVDDLEKQIAELKVLILKQGLSDEQET